MKKAQVTIFIIIAILIVASIGIYYALNRISTQEIPVEMKPVYDYYLSCLEENAKQGISLLGEQGGYIKTPEFVPGSQYMPFSSQLDFFGQPVVYWMYISGNNLLKEQVPTKSSMQSELATYVQDRLDYCDFSEFNNEGFDVFVGTGNVEATIKDNQVDISAENPIIISKENQSVSITTNEISVTSKLGKFYNLALKTYNYEKENMFLENYALDALRLYAPVDGVEFSCTPMVLNENQIKNDIADAMSANIGAVKLKGSYYNLAKSENKYYVVDTNQNVDENVNFIYSKNFPTAIEIYGDDVIEPVGLQEGLGILGFCYIPYHIIYDVNFPVLIQFYDNEEVFQFPISVIISKNQAREALPTTAGSSVEGEVCKYKNQDVSVYTYDANLNPVPANIKFKCLNTECFIGKTYLQGDESYLTASMPQCVNGFILASAEGYANSKYQISTNEENVANILLRKKFNITLEMSVSGNAIVNFKSEDYSATAIYPDYKSVELVEGYYNITAYVYKNTSLTLPAVSEKKCVSVPKSGIAGLFGREEEKCFDINIPATQIDNALVGGGNTMDYFTEDMLEKGKIKIIVPQFKVPGNINEVADNFVELSDSIIDIEI